MSRAAAQFAELERLIWSDDEDASEYAEERQEDAAIEALAVSAGTLTRATGEIAKAVTALRESGDKVHAGNRDASEQMAGVLGELAGHMTQLAKSLSQEIKAGAECVEDAVTKMGEQDIKQDAETRKAVSQLTASVAGLDARIQRLERVLTAPKRIIVDGNGRPVGVETVVG